MDITIRGIPRDVVLRLKNEAARLGISLNDLVIRILKRAAEDSNVLTWATRASDQPGFHTSETRELVRDDFRLSVCESRFLIFLRPVVLSFSLPNVILPIGPFFYRENRKPRIPNLARRLPVSIHVPQEKDIAFFFEQVT